MSGWKLLRSRVIAGAGAPGEVAGRLSGCLWQRPRIEVLQAQRAGKRPMEASEILRGMVLPAKAGVRREAGIFGFAPPSSLLAVRAELGRFPYQM